MKTNVMTLEGISKEFSVAKQSLKILSDINLDVYAGQTLALTGPSGSGKSTLLAIMAGLESPSSGKVLFKGEPLDTEDQQHLAAWRRRSVGFIFQNFRLVNRLTALENVALPFEIQGRPSEEAYGKGAQTLKRLGLSGREGHFPHQLSGGEQQRVAIARAYAHGPEIIFADEPTGSLDPKTADQVVGSLLELNTAEKTALVLVTHNSEVSSRMDRSLTLSGGTLR